MQPPLHHTTQQLHLQLHYTTLHSTALLYHYHYNCSDNHKYNYKCNYKRKYKGNYKYNCKTCKYQYYDNATLHLQLQLQLHHTSLPYTALHYHQNYNCNYSYNYTTTTLHCSTLHWWHSTTLIPPTRHDTTLHYNYTTLQLHCTTLHPAVVGEVTTATIPQSTTPVAFWSISGFALPPMHHSNSPLHYLSYSFQTSATALCGTTSTGN